VSEIFDALIESDIRYLELQQAVEMVFEKGLYTDNSREFVDKQGGKSWLHKLPKPAEDMPQIYILFKVSLENDTIRVYDLKFAEESLN